MSVLNVLDTQTISAAGTGYIVVKTGVIRCYCAAASSIQIDAGPAITLAAILADAQHLSQPPPTHIARRMRSFEIAYPSGHTVLTSSGAT